MRYVLLAALVAILAVPAVAQGDRPASKRERAQVARAMGAEPRCVTVRVSTVNRRWSLLYSAGKADCPAADGFVILRKRRGAWHDRLQGAGTGPCSEVRRVPVRVARDLEVCS